MKHDNIERKFVDTITTDEWEVLSDSGWVDIHSVSRTIPYQKWRIITETNKVLECADTHIVFDKNMNEIFVNELSIGDEIVTSNGIEKIIDIESDMGEEEMYDLSVGGDNRYYTSGILSHNSLIVSTYILWLSQFCDEPKNIFILANKGEQARSLLNNIKIMYEELPPWLKKGVTADGYAKVSVKFEDNTMIKTAGTTSDAIRGQSISFLMLDEFAFVPLHIAEDFYTAVQPTLATGGSICIISTPHGATGLFYELYTKAKETGKNGYKSFEVPWNAVPGRDERWRDETIKDIGLVKYLQEYECIRGDSFINIRDSNTGKIETISIGDLYERYKQQTKDTM